MSVSFSYYKNNNTDTAGETFASHTHKEYYIVSSFFLNSNLPLPPRLKKLKKDEMLGVGGIMSHQRAIHTCIRSVDRS
jgi:hypothetical protein